MARRKRFKLFLFLIVLIPVFTLCMVFGVEWSYVEKLRDSAAAHDISRPKVQSHFSESLGDTHNRVPLGNNELNVGDGGESLKNVRRKKRDFKRHSLDEHKLEVNEPLLIAEKGNRILGTKGNTSLILSEAKIYKALKERKKHELRVEKSMREFWWYLRNQLQKKSSPDSDLMSRIKDIHNAMQLHYEELNQVDGSVDDMLELNWKYWQKKLSIDMTKLMQRRLYHLQNPPDCKAAKKLVCSVAKTCGFGCQIHHVSYCFILAYATNRTLILDSGNWRYAAGGWKSVFQPLSTTCAKDSSAAIMGGPNSRFSMDSESNSIFLPPVDSLNPRPVQLPMAIPRDLADRMMSFHGAPFVWFISQFLHYLMRPGPELEKFMNAKRTAIGIETTQHPIVGIHVRRTDKRSEASYHDLQEYMKHVEEWYQLYELSHRDELPITRRMYIATDEPTVLQEARKKYTHYEIYSDADISSLASKTNTRYSTQSLYGVIFDITMLSECDYIVCTFSSQVCRVAYELMQKYHIDASQNYYSLDDVYYFGGQQGHDVVAIQDNTLENVDSTVKRRGGDELQFEIGDHLGIAGNEKNGFSVGIHRESYKKGVFPSYKVEEHVMIADFPRYNDA